MSPVEGLSKIPAISGKFAATAQCSLSFPKLPHISQNSFTLTANNDSHFVFAFGFLSESWLPLRQL